MIFQSFRLSSEWGWNEKAEGGWEICWTIQPEVTQALLTELIRCDCKKKKKKKEKEKKRKKVVADIASVVRLPCIALCLVLP